MNILQVTAPGEFEILDVPTPEPGVGQVLIRIEAVTTCPQWDLHLLKNDPMFVGHKFHYPYTPGQPGHEAAGVIAALGAGVREFQVGDHVCMWRDVGHASQGCYAQYVVRDVNDIIRVPKEYSFQAVAPLELAMCVAGVFTMLKEMNVLENRVFGISGLGPAGLIATQIAKAEGASRTIGFDPTEGRRAFALRLGLDAAYDPRRIDDSLFPARPNGPKLDCAVDCVGLKASVEFLMDRTSDVVALFGVQREDYTFRPRHYNGLRLCGYKGHHFSNAQYALDLIKRGALRLDPLVTHTLPLERYMEGLSLLARQEAVKVCFQPWG